MLYKPRTSVKMVVLAPSSLTPSPLEEGGEGACLLYLLYLRQFAGSLWHFMRLGIEPRLFELNPLSLFHGHVGY